MKRVRRLRAIAVVLAVIAGGLIVWPRRSAESGAAMDTAGPTARASTVPREQKPVGWVFGRLMGFPGADRPLTTTVGPANRPLQPLPPPRGSNHP